VAAESSPGAKRAANLSVRGDLLAAARELGINLSGLLEWAIGVEIARSKRLRWRAENAGSIRAYNDNLEAHGTFAGTELSL